MSNFKKLALIARDISQNVTGDGRCINGTHFNTSHYFFKGDNNSFSFLLYIYGRQSNIGYEEDGFNPARFDF